jgi:hypothetical protein
MTHKGSFLKYLHPRCIYFWIALIILSGAALRTVQFVSGGSMWFDELTSAINVQSRTFSELATESLDFNQVAPVGFLFGQKLSTSLFGENDHAFRLLPWLWSLVSLIFFFLTARFFLKGGPLIGAMILFAGSISQFEYAGQAKQYSGDVAICIFLVWSAICLLNNSNATKLKWVMALVGATGILSCFQAIPLSLFLLTALYDLSAKDEK